MLSVSLRDRESAKECQRRREVNMPSMLGFAQAHGWHVYFPFAIDNFYISFFAKL